MSVFVMWDFINVTDTAEQLYTYGASARVYSVDAGDRPFEYFKFLEYAQIQCWNHLFSVDPVDSLSLTGIIELHVQYLISFYCYWFIFTFRKGAFCRKSRFESLIPNLSSNDV